MTGIVSGIPGTGPKAYVFGPRYKSEFITSSQVTSLPVYADIRPIMVISVELTCASASLTTLPVRIPVTRLICSCTKGSVTFHVRSVAPSSGVRIFPYLLPFQIIKCSLWHQQSLRCRLSVALSGYCIL